MSLHYCHCVMFTASGATESHCDVPPLLSLCYVYCLWATDSLQCPSTTVTVLRLLPAGLLTHCDVPPLLSLCYVYCSGLLTAMSLHYCHCVTFTACGLLTAMTLHYCHCVTFTASGLLTHCDVPPLLSLCYVYCLWATDSLRCPSTTVTVLRLLPVGY